MLAHVAPNMRCEKHHQGSWQRGVDDFPEKRLALTANEAEGQHFQRLIMHGCSRAARSNQRSNHDYVGMMLGYR